MGYIKTVIAIILIKPIISVILPDESIKKYINYVAGLMIIILLVTPISKISIENIFNIESNVEVPNYKDISDKNIKETYENQLENELSQKFNVSVEVEVDDNLKIIKIQSEKQQEIEEYLGIWMTF